MKTIEVEIDYINDYPKDYPLSQGAAEAWLISKLKKAGIPMNGTLVFKGVKRGKLSRYEEPERPGVSFYRWTDEEGEGGAG